MPENSRQREKENGTLLVSVAEAAKLLGIGRGLAYQLVQEKRLPSVKLGRRVLVPRQALEEWVAREAGLPQPAPSVVSSLPQH